jgi:hypothetical protein
MVFLLAGKQVDYNGKNPHLRQADDFPGEKYMLALIRSIKEI